VSNLADTVARFATGIYQVTRRPKGQYVQGRLVTVTPSTLLVSACVQPASGRQLQRLPDGMRLSETISIWSEVELFVKTATSDPDLIEYRGNKYEVQISHPWDEHGNFFESVAVKVG